MHTDKIYCVYVYILIIIALKKNQHHMYVQHDGIIPSLYCTCYDPL